MKRNVAIGTLVFRGWIIISRFTAARKGSKKLAPSSILAVYIKHAFLFLRFFLYFLVLVFVSLYAPAAYAATEALFYLVRPGFRPVPSVFLPFARIPQSMKFGGSNQSLPPAD